MAPQFLAELCESARKLKPKISGRILARLIEAEWLASDVWVCDDYRIAYLTVLYASRGDRSPHVTATYKVLGLHPDKVFGAVTARRKAQLGRFYELWSLPPRKPAESYRPAQQEVRQVVGKENFRPQKPSGAESDFRATWKPISGKPARTLPIETMASTQTSYRESFAQTSAKNQGYVSRESIAAMIRSADLSVETHAQILTKGNRFRPGVRRYRRRHLNLTLLGMWQGCERPYGKNSIEFYAAVQTCADAARMCERQYRYNLRALEQTGIIRLVQEANTPKHRLDNPKNFRHTSRHELNLDALRQRCRKLPVPIKSDPVQSEPEKQEPPKPAPVAASKLSQTSASHHSAKERKLRILTPRQGRDFVQGVIQRMQKGSTQQNALLMTAQLLGIPIESAAEHLKLVQFNFAAIEAEAAKGGKCERHPHSGLTQWGTCWACYAHNTGDLEEGDSA